MRSASSSWCSATVTSSWPATTACASSASWPSRASARISCATCCARWARRSRCPLDASPRRSRAIAPSAKVGAMLTAWCLVIGLLLIGMGLTDTMRRDLPFSASALYLLAGWLIGPQVGGLLHLDLFGDARLIEVLTEAAVLISLFAVGMRLRVRLTDRLWLTPLLLATVAMLLTIGAMTVVYVSLGLSLGAALLLAAVLSPT